MKTFTPKIAAFVMILPSICSAQPAKTDPFDEGMRQAYADYKSGNHEAVTGKLRELIQLVEDKGAAKVGDLMPDSIGDWKGESLRRSDLAGVGGGISMERTYVSNGVVAPKQRTLLIKVVKDSPLLKQLLPLIANEDLIRMGNRKSHRISGETAIMEGEHKMQLVLDGRILIELSGDDSIGERDLLGIARKLDLSALAKIK